MNNALASGGTTTITNAGLFTKSVTGAITSTGAFTQNGTSTISLGANITTIGTNLSIANTITLTAAAVQLSTGAGPGDVILASAVDGASALTITAGTGTVTVLASIGAAISLTSLTVSGTAVTLNGIGDAPDNGVSTTISVTATTGAITLFADHYKSGGVQSWTASTAATGGVRYLGTAPGTWSGGGAGINLPATDLYLDHDGLTLTLGSNLSCRNLYFYRGSLNLAGRTVTTSTDFVVFGSAYSADDGDWSVVGDTRHAYHHGVPLAYYPGAATHNGHTVVFTGAGERNANFPAGGLLASVVTITGSFYNNGSNMNAGAFTLNLPAGTGTAPVFNNTAAVIAGQWGTPYAAAFNMTVANATTNGGWVSAVSSITDPDGVGPELAEANHAVVNDGGMAGTGGWQFSRPQISWAATIYDDVIRVEFHDQFGAPINIENSANEINTRVSAAAASAVQGSVWYNIGALKFDGTFIDAACTTSTNGAGDLPAFFIRTTAGNWNTDATGLTAGDDVDDTVPAGDDRSTDRDGTSQARRVDLSFLKGLFRSADGKTMVRNYGPNGFPSYTATVDRCRPVLVRVEVGQAAHSTAPYETWDGHNYFQLKWSEPVNLGNSAGFTILDATAANVKSQAVFVAMDEYGGYTSGAGTVTVAGYLTVGGTVDVRSRDLVAADDTKVNGLYRAAPNAYGTHGLFISLAGYSFAADGTLFWPGYIQAAVQPIGTITALDNEFILDAQNNRMEPTSDTVPRTILGSSGPVTYSPRPKLPISVTTPPNHASVATLSGWDVAPPEIVDNGSDFDVVPFVTTGGETRIERFEISFTQTMRDSSLTYPTATASGLYTFPPAFEFRAQDGILPYRYGGSILSTAVQSPYLAGPLNIKDDSLLSIVLDVLELTPDWTTTSQMYFTYDREIGFVTDWAGNRLPDYTTLPSEKACIEKIPPRIKLGTAIEADVLQRIYVVFTEPVAKGPYVSLPGIPSTNLQTSDFILTNAGVNITSVSPITLDSDGWILDAYLNLDGPVTLSAMLNARLEMIANVNSIVDKRSNTADIASRRAVDIGMGVINVLAASDGIHGEFVGTDPSLPAGALGLLRSFDGTGRLYDRDITLFTSMDLTPPGDAPTLATLPLQVYFDAEAPADSYEVFNSAGRAANLNLWLPTFLPGYNREANSGARNLAPFFSGTLPSTVRNFLIPASDPDMATGKDIGFMFRLGGLYLAREAVANDPRSFDLWRFKVQDIIQQRGGVTVVNNVIDSNKRERTAIQVDLTEGGQVTILVFTLDGDIVKALHRGRLGAGTYTFTWDGTNSAGRPVARGMYFVRVVGSGIDEIRKVMVIKD